MPIGKYPRKPLQARMRSIPKDDPRNIFTQAHFQEAWLSLAGAIGRTMADEDYRLALQLAGSARKKNAPTKKRSTKTRL